MNVILKISKAELETIIMEYIGKQGFAGSKIEFKVHSREEGDQRDSTRVHFFDGVEIEATSRGQP